VIVLASRTLPDQPGLLRSAVVGACALALILARTSF